MSTGTSSRPCRNFSATGHCRFGERCRFSHHAVNVEGVSSVESSAVSTQVENPASTPQDRREICRYFKAGRCTRGESCRWSHEVQDTQGSSLSNENKAKSTNARKGPEEDADTTLGQQVNAVRALIERAKHQDMQESSSNNENKAKSTNARKGPAERIAMEEKKREEAIKLEERRQAEEALLEVQRARERKAKQVEIAERETSVVIRQVVMGGSTLVTCGAGLDVRHIVCGFESCFVTIKNLPRNVKPHEIEDLFTQQGIDSSLFYIVNRRYLNDEVEAKVMIDSENGHAVAAGLDGLEFQDKFLDITIDDGGVPNKMGSASDRNVNTLTITWKLPTSAMMAQYATLDEAQNAVRRLNNTIFGGRKIRAELQRRASMLSYISNASIKITGLPPTATTTEVENHSGADMVWNSSVPSAFESRGVERELRRILGLKKGFERCDVSPPNPNKFNAEARVRFRTWEDAKSARDSLDGRRLGFGYPVLRFWLPKPIQYVITIPLTQYRAQKGRWDSLPTEGINNKGAFVRVTNNNTDKAFIRVLGEDKQAVGQLKVRVENLVVGEILPPELWHRSFMGRPGQRLLDNISARSKAYVRADWKSKELKLYADANTKQIALELISAEIARLESLEWSESIHRRAIGFFLRKGLQVLKEELGEDAATLVLVPTPRLIIRGGEEARRTVDRLMEESRMGIESEAKDSEQDTCPICFDEVTSPVMLSCGHLYCTACLRHFLSSAAERKTFPLVCSGNEDRCKAPIAIPIIQRYMLQQQFDQLVEAAVTTHIERQPTKFRYCTTPDCPQAYRCQTGNRALTCPSCFASVCTGCHKEAHEGMTCREREVMNNPEEQERLNEEWAQGAGAKRCPNCRVWVQKTEGCNHMTCRCGAHLCWICLMVFRDGGGVYTHLNAVHGGIDRDPPAVQNARLQQEQADLAFARRLQAEEDGRAGNGGRLQAQPFAHPLLPQLRDEQLQARAHELEERRRRVAQERVAQGRVDWGGAQQQRIEEERYRAQQETRAREMREMAERQRRAAEEQRNAQNQRGGWCVVM